VIKRLALSSCSVVVVVVVVGCFEPPGTFALPCTGSEECAGLQCRPDDDDGTRRCLPFRQRGELGESCANPRPARAPTGTDRDLVLDELMYFGDAADDVSVDVDGVTRPDVSLSFILPSATGLRVVLDAPLSAELVVGLRRSGCDAPFERFGIARPGVDAVIPVVPLGTWELVIDGKVENAGTVDEVPVHVLVTRLPCALGYVPVDNECVGFRAVSPLAVPRIGAGVSLIANRMFVAGGVDAAGVPQQGAELFDLRRESWEFVDLFEPRRRTVVAPSGDDLIVVGGDLLQPLVEIVVAGRLDDARDPIKAFSGPSAFELDLSTALALTDVGAGVTAGVTPGELFNITRTRKPKECSRFFDLCGLRGACVFVLDDGGADTDNGVCVCGEDDPDCFVDFLEFREVPGLSNADAIAAVDGATLMHDATGFVRLLETGDDFPELIGLGGAPRTGVAFVALGDQRHVLALGGVAGGAALDLVESYDAATDEIATLAPLPTPIAAPHAALAFDDRVLVVGDDDDVAWLVRGGEVAALLLPSVRSGVTAVSLPGGAALVGGITGLGPSGDVLLLDRQPLRGKPEAAISRCRDAAGTIEGSGVFSGTTAGHVDRFRAEQCVDRGVGRDVVYQLHLDVPSRVHVGVDDNDDRLQLVLLESCDPPREFDCANATVDLDIERLEAGDWYVVVDDTVPAFSTFFPLLVDFTLTVTIEPSEACPPDAFDPADDVVAGAGGFDFGGVQTASRTLCNGDVDHVLIDHAAADDFITLRPSGSVAVSLSPAVVDEAASIAARTLVFSASAFEEFGGGNLTGPPGLYVLKAVGSGDDAGLAVRRRTSCARDPNDSILGALDDDVDPAARPLLGEEPVVRSVCLGDLRDVTLVTLSAGEVVQVSGGPVEAALLRVTEGLLGAEVARGESLAADVDGSYAVVVTAAAEAPSYALTRASFFADRCEEARPLPPAGALTGSTEDFADDLDAERLGDCTGFQSRGLDMVFAIDIGAGESFSAVLDPVNFEDVSLYLLSSCPANADDDVCVVGDDSGNTGDDEAVTFTNNGPAGRFFIVVDAFDTTGFDFSFEWNVQ
jgi:hypothetical protein